MVRTGNSGDNGDVTCDTQSKVFFVGFDWLV
jgi:hypothetical protein